MQVHERHPNLLIICTLCAIQSSPFSVYSCFMIVALYFSVFFAASYRSRSGRFIRQSLYFFISSDRSLFLWPLWLATKIESNAVAVSVLQNSFNDKPAWNCLFSYGVRSMPIPWLHILFVTIKRPQWSRWAVQSFLTRRKWTWLRRGEGKPRYTNIDE